MSKPPESEELTVNARSPFHIYYEGKAKVVSAANIIGPFDILPGHADFFSVMNPGTVVIETGTDTITFKANNGIVCASSNEVMLFVNM